VPEFLVSSYIHAPIERVWAFHEAPDALEKLTPPSVKLEVLLNEGGIAVGARKVIRVPVLGPIRSEWHAIHTVCDAPRLFIDEQERGPFAYWHHEHRFQAHNQGTQLTDAITFELPGGWLVNFFGAPFVRLQLRGMFRHRHAVTKKCCESGG
jgi:ligand-binding SRPBCC domain-containing protein